MYVRIARFEELDPSRTDQQIAEMKRQIQEARSSGGVPEGAPEQVQTLMETVKRFVQFIDRENGRALGLAFCESEADLKRADAAFNEMSPGEGEGRRTSLEMYEVVVDESFE